MPGERFDVGHAHKPRRDTYGFALRPQFVQTYKEHAHIYQEEEGERSHKWKDFLEHVQNSSKPRSLQKEHIDKLPKVVATERQEHIEERQAEPTEQKEEVASKGGEEGNVKSSPESISRSLSERDLKKEVQVSKEESKYKSWDFIRPSLSAIEIMMSVRVRKKNSMIDKLVVVDKDHLPIIEEVPSQEACEDSQEDDLFLDAASESSSASNEVSNGMKVSREEKVVDNGVSDIVPADDKTNEVPDSMNVSVEEQVADNDVCNNVPDGDQTKEVSNDMKASVEKEVVNNGVCHDVSDDDQTSDVSDGIKVSGEEYVADNGVCENLPSDDQTKEVSDGIKVSEKEEVADNGVCRSVAADDQKKDEVANGIHPKPFFPWKQELESLVHGGVPRDLRGEVWQAFVGVKTRRVEKYYYELLAEETDTSDSMDNDNAGAAFRKWRKQIEKDIPRTFPGHPALDENGRNSLRRLLIAYARHNPSVGYCQAMNFFAGLLLLMMPEENAFWTFVGIIDDYFSGYYTEEMIESQVDQLVFEDLAREKFPKLVNHLDYLGVQVTWIIGPWFLSIFVNMIPWESVIRVWDVILFEGNRVMLFRTALALLELYGPAVVATKDAGDAITLMQSLVGSTFDSSQLVLTACMGFLAINETKLKDLRDKHRPTVLEVVEERARAKKWKDSKGLSKKLYSFKHDPLKEEKTAEEESTNGDLTRSKSDSSNVDDLLEASLSAELDSLADPQDQVHLLKVELCKVLEEKRFVLLRSEELETALMEMVKLDNRRELTARTEKLEREVVELCQSLNDKTEQEAAVMKVLKLVEQEQRVADDARISAEQEAIKQKHALCALQENYDKAMSLLAEMEKKVKVAESMLEATLQYESGQAKAVSSPRSVSDTTQGSLARKIPLLSFRLGWGDRKKGSNDNSKLSNEQPPREETAPTPEDKNVQEHVEGK